MDIETYVGGLILTAATCGAVLIVVATFRVLVKATGLCS
jgi:hypothetical protein